MKKFFLFIALLFTYLIIFNTNTIYAQELEINSKYAILYNLDDNLLLYEKNSNTQVPMASLTKIMTTLVAIENIKDFNQTVTLGANVFQGLAEANASVAGFKYNEKVTYYDLLMGAMLPSGADATRGLAINISGSEAQYVELMNKKAQELNLKNTHFANTTGLESNNHYSTAQDIATLLQYALKNETFKKIYTTREYTTTNGLKMYSTLKKISKNYTIDVSNILGSKTGFTDEAGYCMSSIANYNNINYLLITLGADKDSTSPLQLYDAKTIYEYYAANYSYKNIIEENQQIDKIKIKYSKEKEYEIKSDKTITKYLENTFQKENVKYIYEGKTELTNKDKKDEEIGKIIIQYNNETLDTIPVILKEEIKFDTFEYLLQTKLIYPIGFALLIIIFIIIKPKKKKKENIIVKIIFFYFKYLLFQELTAFSSYLSGIFLHKILFILPSTNTLPSFIINFGLLNPFLPLLNKSLISKSNLSSAVIVEINSSLIISF